MWGKTLQWLKPVLLAALAANALAQDARPPALLLEVKGAIGPVTTDFVVRGIDLAAQRGLPLVVLQLDTPGGLDAAMRDIVKAVLAAPLPVVTYVAPSGARAASAGTYIVYASHFAAAAPGTNLGAATPVQLGGTPGLPQPQGDGKPPAEESDAPADNATAMRRKVVEDAAAYIRSLATLRGRNAEWAEKAVLEGASLSATEALEQGVIDMVATDVADLMAQLHGRETRVGAGEVSLDSRSLGVERHEADWRNRLLSVISNPNLAYMLLLIGIYGLIMEFSNPGYFLPGVVGAICLLLALFALQILPINYAGLALMLLGIAFMVAEAFLPSFGALGLGGVVAFLVGSLILVDDEGMSISLPLVLGTTLVSAAFFLWVLGRLAAMRRKPVVSGMEEMIGSVGSATDDFVAGEGRIWVHGESWRAHGDSIRKGQRVRVVGVAGLVLEVDPLTEEA